MSSSCINQTMYNFTVFILIRAVLIRVNAMLSNLYTFFLRGLICWQLLVAAGSNLGHMDCLRKEYTQYTFFTYSNGHLHSHRSSQMGVSSHTDSGSQSYCTTRRTYLTDFVLAVYVQNPSNLSFRNFFSSWVVSLLLMLQQIFPFPCLCLFLIDSKSSTNRPLSL